MTNRGEQKPIAEPSRRSESISGHPSKGNETPLPIDAQGKTVRGIAFWVGIGWLVLACTALAYQLGEHALVDPDEGRNASIALEMERSGEFLLPHLNGLPFLDKPFLFFALGGVAMRSFGASEFAARLPSLLAAWAVIALTGWFAARRLGGSAGWIAAVACATSPMLVVFARTAIFDSLLSLFIVGALVAFYLAIEVEPRDSGHAVDLGWTRIAWVAMALGVLTKGPVALLIPLMVAVPFAVWRRRSRAVWHPSGWSLLLAIIVPWLWIMEAKAPGFLHYALVTETFERLTTDTMNRTGPIWYFLPYLLGGAFPWIFIVIGSARLGSPWWKSGASESERFFSRSRRKSEGISVIFRALATPSWWKSAARSAARLLPRAATKLRWSSLHADPMLVYLFLWVVLPLVFFSLSQSKRPHYILPLIPAVALLAARTLSRARFLRRGNRTAALGWLVLGALFLALRWGLLPLGSRVDPERAGLILATTGTLGLLAMAAAGAGWLAAKGGKAAVIALSAPIVLLPLVAQPLLSEIAADRSTRDLVSAIDAQLAVDIPIVAVETFPPSIVFYSGRSVLVTTKDGRQIGSTSVHRHFSKLAADDRSTLRPLSWWWSAATRCEEPSVFVLQAGNDIQSAALEQQGLPLLYRGHRHVAYGPCTAENSFISQQSSPEPVQGRLPMGPSTPGSEGEGATL